MTVVFARSAAASMSTDRLLCKVTFRVAIPGRSQQTIEIVPPQD